MRQIGVSFSRLTPREVSLRRDAVGGPIRTVPAVSPRLLIERGRRLMVLIHGFNVGLAEAKNSYNTFGRELNLNWRARLAPVFWPGDARPPGANRKLRNVATVCASALTYPFQIATAQRCASLLANRFEEAIRARRAWMLTRLELVIVAHSLGCRLTLEFIRQILERNLSDAVRFRLTVLMAAAVPRYMIQQGGTLRDALATSERALVLRSASDEALTFAFRPGQIVEAPFPNGWNPIARGAIGRKGCGQSRPRNVTEIVGERRHGDYWPDGSIPSAVIQELDGAAAALAIFRRLEFRRRPKGRRIEFRIVERRP